MEEFAMKEFHVLDPYSVGWLEYHIVHEVKSLCHKKNMFGNAFNTNERNDK